MTYDCLNFARGYRLAQHEAIHVSAALLAGCWLLAAGCWLLAAGCCLLMEY
jgi:hypothetical protein